MVISRAAEVQYVKFHQDLWFKYIYGNKPCSRSIVCQVSLTSVV